MDILWPPIGMTRQSKTRMFGAVGLLGAVAAISGCTSSHPSTAWQGNGAYVGNSGHSAAIVYSPALENSGSLVFSSEPGPEFSRRDFTMATRDVSRRDELFGVRAESYPSLNNRRTFRSSRRADEYSYPSEQGKYPHRYRRYYRD